MQGREAIICGLLDGLISSSAVMRILGIKIFFRADENINFYLNNK